MVLGNPYAKYQEQAVKFSSPEKLLLMLFEGAIKFSGQARIAIEEKNIEKANNLIHKCENIMNYLINTLDPKYEVSSGIEKMYDYISYNFTQANVTKDLKYLDEADLYLKEFRETWRTAAKLSKEGNEQIPKAL